MLNIEQMWRNPIIKNKKSMKEFYVLCKLNMKGKKAKRSKINVVFIIDRSGSMRTNLSNNRNPDYKTLQQIWDLKNKQNPSIPNPLIPGTGTPFIPDSPYKNTSIRSPFWTDQNGMLINNQQLNNVNNITQLQDIAKELLETPTHYEKPLSKLDLVKKATIKAIGQLQDDDLVSIITFDDKVDVLCSGISAKNKEELIKKVEGITTGGMTDLFSAWWKGAYTLTENMKEGYLNRVLLLTDGQTNAGEMRTDVITNKLAELAAVEVSTSTFGVGSDYNEDLLQKMAEKGEGNYYYIKNDEDFEELFKEEFININNIATKKTLLSINTKMDYEIVNDFEKTDEHKYKLGNLIFNKEKEFLIKVIPGKIKNKKIELEISYLFNGEEVKYKLDLNIPQVEKEDYFENQEVIDKIAELAIVKEKEKAIKALDRGDINLARATLNGAIAMAEGSSAQFYNNNLNSITSLSNDLESGNHTVLRKTALYENYNSRNTKEK